MKKEIKGIYIDQRLIEAARVDFTYERANLTIWQKIKIFFRLMEEPPRVKISNLLMDLIPKVKWKKEGWKTK